jgi:molybdenum cofactor cytidylyltransferase
VNAAAVILAGGASRRMGFPKALLTIGSDTFADRLINVFTGLCSPVVVVLGHEAERIQAGIASEARFVINPDHALGQLTSLQCGLRSVETKPDAVLFTPVDYPSFSRDTVTSLLHAFEVHRSPVVVPRCDGRHGHPVLIASNLIGELLALPADASARDVIHRHAGHTLYVDVDDPGINRDVDDPDAYRALLQVAP